ncbi:uncharacterized protein LOC117123548 [Anneissia japonica]|uniref:uncharacterized protein LOC117123548 n=1 Tax=Anneissia japonica TaxID=1529436 RepID=UPI0014259A2B|nr:uncharacterized protein LOC117123548 [Anneissia japonica]XP_033125409.1 uncharacterized protein LOC117123548 [Anneissia japonica]
MTDINSNRSLQCIICCDPNIPTDKLQTLDCKHTLCQECIGEITTKNNEKIILCPECNCVNFLPSLKTPSCLCVEKPDYLNSKCRSPLSSPKFLRRSPSPTTARLNPPQQMLYTKVKELRKDLKNMARQENSEAHKTEKHYGKVKSQIEAQFGEIVETLMTRKKDVIASVNLEVKKDRAKREKGRAEIQRHLRFWTKFEGELKTFRQYSEPEVEAMTLKCTTLQEELKVNADQIGQTPRKTFDSSKVDDLKLMASNFGRLLNAEQDI